MRAYRVDAEIKILVEEKEKAFEKAVGLNNSNEDVRVRNSPGNINEEKFAVFADYAQTLERRIAELSRIKSEIIQAIECVENPVYRQLLILRYIQFKKWDEIAIQMHYEPEHVRGPLHRAALRKIGEILNLT